MRRAAISATYGPPPLPAPAFQTRTTGGVTTGFTVTVDKPSGTVDGDFVVVMVGGSRASVPTTSLSGFTKMLEIAATGGGAGGFLSIYGKIASGEPSTWTFSCTSTNTNMTYVAERWTGVVGFSSGLTGVADGTTSPALTSNTVNTTVANSVVLTAIGGRTTSGGSVSPVWGGGATAAYGTASGRIGFNNNATETKATAASVTHTCSITNTQGAPMSCIGSVVLAPA